ncbi:MAG TPA: YdcF family protein [Pyrinomonadaceae bacterium]|nr:YdcF family protein [Pyrinomonadaceae bacterium]
MRRRVLKVLVVTLILMLIVTLFTAANIYSYGNTSSEANADAAIVLGAAVWGNQVSPVFKERINHAINLYRQGRIRKLIFTGGQGNRNEPTEAAAARNYALQNGVPLSDVLIEQQSHTTYENMVYAKRLADQNGLKKILIVSDPLHMKRAVTMAHDVGLDAYPSPTPTSKYRSLKIQTSELARETFYYLGYCTENLIGRPLR